MYSLTSNDTMSLALTHPGSIFPNKAKSSIINAVFRPV